MRAILTYHSIDPSESPISVDPGTFRAHVRWMASGGVDVVPLEEIPALGVERDAVAVTFDDALESFERLAAPLLLDAGIPVTVFVVSDHVGGRNDWDDPSGGAVPDMAVMGWDELGRLVERGVAVGAHTRTHPHLTRVPPDALDEEVAGSARRIEAALGVLPTTFAYPYGAHDEASVAAARRSFEVACTTELGPLGPGDDPLLLPRLDMVYFRGVGRLEAWGTSGFRRYIGLRRAGRRLRTMLGRVVAPR